MKITGNNSWFYFLRKTGWKMVWVGCCLFCSTNLFAQNWQWSKSQVGNGFDVCRNSTTDKYGNIYLTGGFSSAFWVMGSDTLINKGSYDIFIVKYDLNGNVLWAKSAGGSQPDMSYEIACDLNFGNGVSLGQAEEEDIFIAKYNQNGNAVWAQKTNSYGGDFSNGITSDNFGNIYVTGHFFGPVLNFGGWGGIDLQNDSYLGYVDLFIAKYNSIGNLQWAKKYGNYYSDYGRDITVDLEGNVFLTGYFQSDSIVFGNTKLLNESSHDTSDVFIVKYDSTGNIVWAKKAGGTGHDFGTSICAFGNESVYLSGYFNSSEIYFDNDSLFNGGSSNIFVGKICNYGVLVTNNLSICNGDSIFLQGSYQTTSGIYYDTLQNFCDTIIVTTLVVDSVYSTLLSSVICNGDSVYLQGNYQVTAGVYYDTLSTVCNQDSIIITTLSIYPSNYSQQVLLCNGDSVFVGGNYQTTAGTYYDTLQPVNGCDSIVETVLTVNSVISNQYSVSICSGDSVFLSGSWQFAGGCYYDTLQAVNGCDSVVETVLTVNSNPNLFITTTDVTCHDSCNGYLNPVANGGTSPYTYIFSNGSDWWFPLCAGTYSFTVTDANGCIATESATINEPPILSMSVSITDVTCYGICNGNAVVNVSGGASPYNYNWGSPCLQCPPFPNTWCAGNYFLDVTDANGCIISDSFLISQPDSIILSLTSTPDSGNANGTTTVVASGGTAPYGYSWSTLSGFETLTGLGSGIYSVTVTDANGCDMVDSVLVDFYSGLTEVRSPKPEVLIVPNPNGGRFELSVISNQFSVIGIKIYNILGEEIYRILFTDYRTPITIDLGKAGSGMYYVQVTGENGVMTKRIIVE